MNTMEESGRHWDDEIGLERYVLTLIAWWREILLGTLLLGLLGGVVAAAVRAVLPDYRASADVAIIRTHTDVAIDDRFRAVATGNIRRGRDHTARRFALLGLVHQGDVARTVFGKLADLWEDDEYSEADLLESISAELVTNDDVSARHKNESDLIRIRASADSPEKAAIVANAWASEFVHAVNVLYKPVPENVIVRVDNEMKISEKHYTGLQEELEALIANSDSGMLAHWIEINNLKLQSLRELWHTIATTLSDIRLNDQIASLSYAYEARRRTRRLLIDTNTLRAQIEEQIKANVASNGIRFSNQLLSLQAYISPDNIPEGLEITLDSSHPDPASPAELRAEANSIITALTGRLEQLDQIIGSGTEILISNVQHSTLPIIEESQNQILTAIRELEGDNRKLNAQLEKINAEVQRLTQQRDTARSTFETLQNEMTELRLTSAAAPSELRLASRAVEPSKSSRPSPVLVTTVVGTMGLPTLMFVALVLNSVGIRPFLKNRRTESVV